ncbi:MAG TPA: lysophospholipid acyltransferase family protein [Candidatus Limnocylindria bacterium]|nr:lysophospholipid acyltransferase family protein [Candidatus Limnocylindria bacterium]
MARLKRRRSRLGHFFYDLRYRVGEFWLRGFIASVPYIPLRVVERVTTVLAWLSFKLMSKYRRRMEENIASALGKEIPSEAVRRDLVWRAWKNFARGVFDTTAIIHRSKARIVDSIRLDGEEHLQNALANGKGVLALSAHLGGFTMIGARLAAAGYPFSVVVKHPADERFARLTDDYRSQVGIHTIPAKPRRQAARGIIKALRENRIVLVIADEFKSGDVMVDFFGMQLPAPRGPATLALRTGAVTLPMFATRELDDSLLLAVGPAIPTVEREDLEASVVATTATYTGYLEAAIRRYPDQWNWLGLPNRNGKLSRAELALRRKERMKDAAAREVTLTRKTGTGV